MAPFAENGTIDSSTVHQIFKGTYKGSLDGVCAAIGRFREGEERRAEIRRADFVETSLSRRIFGVCEQALLFNSVAFVYGENQIGKSASLLEYQARSPAGVTRYVRMPAAAGVQLVAREIAVACNLSPRSSFENLRHRILNALGPEQLVVIDEMHLVFTTYQKGSAIKILEFVREIHDRTGCGCVLCGTDVWRSELKHGEHRKMLRQLLNRGLVELQLEPRPKLEDLEKFHEFHGLPAPTGEAAEFQADIVRESGLGKYLRYLAAAARIAERLGEPLDWGHFERACIAVATLEKEKD